MLLSACVFAQILIARARGFVTRRCFYVYARVRWNGPRTPGLETGWSRIAIAGTSVDHLLVMVARAMAFLTRSTTLGKSVEASNADTIEQNINLSPFRSCLFKDENTLIHIKGFSDKNGHYFPSNGNNKHYLPNLGKFQISVLGFRYRRFSNTRMLH